MGMTPNWEGGLGAAWGFTPAWFWDGLRLESLLRAQSGGHLGVITWGPNPTLRQVFIGSDILLKKYIVIDI